jgi:hypothetical protein
VDKSSSFHDGELLDWYEQQFNEFHPRIAPKRIAIWRKSKFEGLGEIMPFFLENIYFWTFVQLWDLFLHPLL